MDDFERMTGDFAYGALESLAGRACLLLAAIVDDFLETALRRRVSMSGRRILRRYLRRSPSSSSTREQSLQIQLRTSMMCFRYPTWNAGRASLMWPKWPLHLSSPSPQVATDAPLARYAHVDVHGPVGGEGARVVGGRREVVDIAVRDFEDGLVDNVLVGAADGY